MNILAILGAEGKVIDDARSIHAIWPADAELIYGTISSVLIFAVIYKFAAPAIKKAMADRTAAVQENLDNSANAKSEAEAEAAEIRRAAGDIDAERQRLFAEADERAEAVLAEGRARLEQEVVDMHTRADAEIVSAGSRINDELRAEIATLSHAATEQVLAGGAVDDATQQELIESFIARVGASS